MDTFVRFLYEFLSVFFSGIGMILMGIVNGFIQIFSIHSYTYVINSYKKDFSGPEWLFVVLAILVLIILVGIIILLIYFVIRKYIRFRKTLVEQESLLEEVGKLNNEVATLVQEKEDILAMKVSQLGLKPGEKPNLDNKAKPETKNGDTPESIYQKALEKTKEIIDREKKRSDKLERKRIENYILNMGVRTFFYNTRGL